jgi:hypothetical protein
MRQSSAFGVARRSPVPPSGGVGEPGSPRRVNRRSSSNSKSARLAHLAHLRSTNPHRPRSRRTAIAEAHSLVRQLRQFWGSSRPQNQAAVPLAHRGERLPKEEQEIFEQLQKRSTGAFSTPQVNQSPQAEIQGLILWSANFASFGVLLALKIRLQSLWRIGVKLATWSYGGRVTDF